MVQRPLTVHVKRSQANLMSHVMTPLKEKQFTINWYPAL